MLSSSVVVRQFHCPLNPCCIARFANQGKWYEKNPAAQSGMRKIQSPNDPGAKRQIPARISGMNTL